MKTSHLLSVFLLGCAALCGGAQNYENPALNPVKFQKNPNHPELLLIKDGKADFAIVADLRTEKSRTGEGATGFPSNSPRKRWRTASPVALELLLRYCLPIPRSSGNIHTRYCSAEAV